MPPMVAVRLRGRCGPRRRLSRHRRSAAPRLARAIACAAVLVAVRAPAASVGTSASPESPRIASTPAAGEIHPRRVEVGRGERLLVVAPHPDDETIAAAGLMQYVIARGGHVEVLLLTAGDGYVDAVRGATGEKRPRAKSFVEYGERRLREFRAAMGRLDRRIRIGALGVPDGGLDDLLRSHRKPGAPERSATTGASDPPYDGEVIEPDLPYDGASLRRAMRDAIRRAGPTIVALPDPDDVHPDHRATGIFALLALDDLARAEGRGSSTGGSRSPRILAYLVHWPSWPPDWERPPEPADAARLLDLPRQLPRRGFEPVEVHLASEQTSRKRHALEAYVTQQSLMPEFLGAFVRRTEPFLEIPVPGAALRAGSPVSSRAP